MPLLPDKKDFIPNQDDLDQQCAWGNFGGLSIDEAYKKFCDRPYIYQEDFMFMGTKAFVYYFPVLEKYIENVVPENNEDDCQYRILASAIEYQLDKIKKNQHNLLPHIKSLSYRVLHEYVGKSFNNKIRRQITRDWKRLNTFLYSNKSIND